MPYPVLSPAPGELLLLQICKVISFIEFTGKYQDEIHKPLSNTVSLEMLEKNNIEFK